MTQVTRARSGLTNKQRHILWTGIRMLLTLPFVALIMIPLLYTFMMSVLPADELYTRFWPSHFDFSSYMLVFTKTMIPRQILNSFIVASSVTILPCFSPRMPMTASLFSLISLTVLIPAACSSPAVFLPTV